MLDSKGYSPVATFEIEDKVILFGLDRGNNVKSAYELRTKKLKVAAGIAILVALALVVALTIGLTVGLSHRTLRQCPLDFDVNKVELVFFIVGDWGRHGSKNQRRAADLLIAMANCMSPSFVISTGDNFYSSGLKSATDPAFQKSFTHIYDSPNLDIPWYSVLGNHDYGDSLATQAAADNQCSATSFKKLSECPQDCCYSPVWQTTPYTHSRDPRWHAQQGVWRFTSQIPGTESFIDFVMLDTTPLVPRYRKAPWAALPSGVSSINHTNLLKDTVSTMNQVFHQDNAWRIAVGHHPVHSRGVHCKGPNSDCGAMKFLKQHLKKYNYTMYLAGHDHNLQMFSPPGEVTAYVVSGAGSDVRTGEFNDASALPADKEMTQFLAEDQGFVAAAITGDILRLYFFTAGDSKVAFVKDIRRPGSY